MNVFMKMITCIMSVLIICYREGHCMYYSLRTFCIRLCMYGLYIVFGLYRYEEENVVCRQAAIFISFVQLLHSIYVLLFTVVREPFKKFVEL